MSYKLARGGELFFPGTASLWGCAGPLWSFSSLSVSYEMKINPRHLKFFKPVGVKNEGNLTLIHTVEEAIEWINKQTDAGLIEAVSEAREKLQEVNDVRIFDLIVPTRKTFADALDTENILAK